MIPGGATTDIEPDATILCIEDEPNLLSDLIEELTAAGYRAAGAVDGREALDLLPEIRPDLVLCDISMPRMNGFEFLARLRRTRPDLADIPVVFLTALTQRDDVVEGMRAGVDEYLLKPIDYDQMLDVIEARLGQKRRVSSAIGQQLDKVRRAVAAESDDAEGLSKVVDILSFGVVLLDETGVISANSAARQIHEDGDGLRIDTALRATMPADAEHLSEFIAAVTAAGRRGVEHLSSFAVSRPSGRKDYALTACALTGPDAARPGRALATVFIADPEDRPQVPSAVLAELFDLEPVESFVARALATGRPVDLIAAELGESRAAIAGHVRSLFDKTGTHRQADLIALILASLSSTSQG